MIYLILTINILSIHFFFFIFSFFSLFFSSGRLDDHSRVFIHTIRYVFIFSFFSTLDFLIHIALFFLRMRKQPMKFISSSLFSHVFQFLGQHFREKKKETTNDHIQGEINPTVYLFHL